MIQTHGRFAEGLRVGDRAVYSRTFTDADVALFGGLTADGNPYHYDAEFARASRFGRPIVHGLLVGGMLTHVGGQWAWLATGMRFEFVAPVYVGDTVTLEVEVSARDEGKYMARARWVKQDGQEVLRGELEGYPARDRELALLARIPAPEDGA